MSIYKDLLLSQIIGGGGGPSVEVVPLSITENGTYSPEEGQAYAPVEVNVVSENKLGSFIDGSVTALTANDLIGATKVATKAFVGRSNLVSLELPEGVTTIEGYAFMGCPKLKTHIWPSTLSSCSDGMFYDSGSSVNIVCKAVTPPTMSISALNDCYPTAIYVPAESVELYKAAPGWSPKANFIHAIPQ